MTWGQQDGWNTNRIALYMGAIAIDCQQHEKTLSKDVIQTLIIAGAYAAMAIGGGGSYFW